MAPVGPPPTLYAEKIVHRRGSRGRGPLIRGAGVRKAANCLAMHEPSPSAPGSAKPLPARGAMSMGLKMKAGWSWTEPGMPGGGAMRGCRE